MKDICESCRAICSDKLEKEDQFCFIEFTCRHGFLFEDDEIDKVNEHEAIKRNLRDWKMWLREKQDGRRD